MRKICFPYKRMISMLLVLICMLGLLPTAALAADAPSSIKMEDCTHNGVHYESPSLGTCWLHQMTFDYNQKSTIGFCAEHGKGMGWSLEGQTWGKPKPITDPTVQTMMAYYYAHTTGVFTDQAHALGVDEVWGSDYSWTMNAWVQAIIWRYKAGLLADPATACAEELLCVYNNLEHTSYSSIDDLLDGMSFRDRTQYILDLGKQGVWGECTVYEYQYTGSSTSSHQAKDVQAIMIGNLDVTREKYDLTVKKVDATNPNKGLPGARFMVRSENGTYEQEIVTGSDGTYTLKGLDASTYSIVELEAPEGYQIDNAGPQYVALPNGSSRAVTVTFTDTPEVTSEGSIRKVDADDPTTGLAGAVIRIDGVDNSFTGTYTTGLGGCLTDVPWDTMPIGSFTATELTPPAGYSLSPDPDKVKQEFVWDGKHDVSLVFENDARVKIELLKLDDSDDPLPDAVFHVVKDGQIIATEKTDSSGRIVVPNVTEGMYAFIEKSVPAPMATLLEPVIVHVDQATVDGGGTVKVTAKDQRLPNLTIWKRDGSDENTVIPGTVFEVKGIHSGFHTDVTTGEDGKAVLTALPVDSFEVTEKSVPAPYVIGDEPTQTIWLGPGDEKELVFVNRKQPLLTIAKSDADDPTIKIPGTVFLVEGIDSDYKDEWTTGEDGTVSKRVDPGSYEITEKSVPSPYYISETESERVQTISLNAGDEKTISFENHKRPFIEIIKENEITHDPIENVKMQVWYASNNTATGEYNDLGVYYTDSEGRIVLSEPDISLRDGWYRVKELDPAPGFALPDEDTQEVFIPAGGSHTFRFQNQPLSAICVWKYDSKTGAALSDCWFQVRYLSGNASGSGGTVIGVYQTSENGSFTVTGCEAGTYIIEELSSDGTHVIDTPPQTVYLSGKDQDVITVTFGNDKMGSLLIVKKDAVTGAPISDVEFFITDSDGSVIGNANGKYVTDSAGTIRIDGLTPGMTVIAKEVRTKEGYILDDTPQSIKIKRNAVMTLEFRNQPKGGVLVKKVDAVTNAPISDVEFFVTDSDGNLIGNANGKFVTDSAGTFTLTDIAPGTTLVVKETRAKAGYILDDTPQTVKVKSNEVTTLEFRNQPKGNLIIVKQDSVTKEPLEGVQFKIVYADGSYVDAEGGTLSSTGLYWTDKAGKISISGISGTIVATEVKSIPGYTIDENTRTQTVVVNPNDTQTLHFYNTPIGGVEIIKVNEDNHSERIPNTTFEIRKVDDALVDTVTTDKNGRVFAALEDGSYYAKEVTSNKSFRLDDTPHYFEIKDGKHVTLQVTNKKLSGIVIHKIDSATGEGIYGVKFVLYDANKKPIGEYTSDDEGYIYIDEIPGGLSGRFYLRELEAAPGYTLDKQYKTVYVSPGKTVEIEWENTAVTGQIQIYKYAAEYNEVTGTAAGTPLKGAVYEIVNARSGKVVDYITTDARGVAASKPLPLTRYQIREVTAPAYWQLDPTVHDVTLEYPGQIIKLSAYDKPASLGVTITKRGNAQVMAGQSMRYDLTVANTSNVPLESFFWHDKIPYDVARPTTLTTGTYSARLNYRVLYKTNYNTSYQVLASNLLTSNNYSFSLNAIPMQAGEVVTDIYFDFGKVPVGFQSVVNPTLSVMVNGNAVNGYQMVNRADVGGKYQGTWQTATASWVTIIRRLWNTPTLPKTGY